jgi:hypothetical protein
MNSQQNLRPKALWRFFSSTTSVSPLTKWECTERARHAFQIYFHEQIEELGVRLNLKGLHQLPVEILEHIINLSWPCRLHSTVVSIAEAANVQNSIISREPTNQLFIFSGKSVYLTRITLTGVSYVSDISYTTSRELIWKGGRVTGIVVGSDGIGITDIIMEGYKTTATKDQQIRAQWYKSIVPRAEESLDRITIHQKV